jgi:pimeloyl-ACP methyl ester carboxylesterase
VPTANQTMILIHGAVLNRRMWDPIAAVLREKYPVITPDLPGHGALAAEPFRLSRAAAVVAEAAAATGPGPVVLLGDSLGSYSAVAAAPALGSRLAGLFLAGCGADLRGPTSWLYQPVIWLARLWPAAKLKASLEARLVREYPSGPAMVSEGLHPEVYETAVAELRDFDLGAGLAAAAVPVWFVNGTGDWRHRWGARRFERLRGVETRQIHGVGHGVTLSRPAEVVALIEEFVAGLRPVA